MVLDKSRTHATDSYLEPMPTFDVTVESGKKRRTRSARKVGALQGMGMTLEKFRRRWWLIACIMGDGTYASLHRKYGLKLVSRFLLNGLIPAGYLQRRLFACLGLEGDGVTFCGDEATLVHHLQRRRAWEIGVTNTQTWSLSEAPSATSFHWTDHLGAGASGPGPGSTTRTTSTSASTSTSSSSPSGTWPTSSRRSP